MAQIEDDRLRDAIRGDYYLRVTAEVLNRHAGLWFADESLIVTRV